VSGVFCGEGVDSLDEGRDTEGFSESSNLQASACT
jgi:hypothetical protein